MGIDINKFEAIKNKARKMIHEDAKLDSSIIKERQADRERTYKSLKGSGAAAVTGFENVAPSYGSNGTSINRISENYSDDNNDALYTAMDNRMKQFTESRQQQPQYPQQIPTQVNKGLPKEILESFSNNYIDQSAFDPNKSVLDTMGIAGDNIQPQQESYASQQVTANSKIDYELIKSIVESSVKKYVNALGKKMLNENNDLAMVQLGDKKINIVTKSGDVYSANLQFVKNIKK